MKKQKIALCSVATLILAGIVFAAGTLIMHALVGLSFDKVDSNLITNNNVSFASNQPTFEGTTSVNDLVSVYDHIEGALVTFGKVSSETDPSITYTTTPNEGFNFARTGMQLNNIPYMDLSPLDGWQAPGVYFFGTSDEISLPATIPTSTFMDSSNGVAPLAIYVYLADMITPGGWMGATADTESKVTIYSAIPPSTFATAWVTFLNQQIGLQTKVDAFAQVFTLNGANIYNVASLPFQSSAGIILNLSSGIASIAPNKLNTLIARTNADSVGNWKAFYGKDELGNWIDNIPSNITSLHASPYGLMAGSRDTGYSVTIYAAYNPASTSNDQDSDGVNGQIETLLGLSDTKPNDITSIGFNNQINAALLQNGSVQFNNGNNPVLVLPTGSTVVNANLSINIQSFDMGGVTGAARGMTSISAINITSPITLYVQNVASNADSLCIVNKTLTSADAATVTKDICQNTWGGTYLTGLNSTNLPQNITINGDPFTIDKQNGYWVITGTKVLTVMEIVDPDGDGFDVAVDNCPNTPGAFQGCPANASISAQLFSPEKQNFWGFEKYDWDQVVTVPIANLNVSVYQCNAINEGAWSVAKTNKAARHAYIANIQNSCQPTFTGATDFYGKLNIGTGSANNFFIVATYSPPETNLEPLELATIGKVDPSNSSNVFNLDVLKYNSYYTRAIEYAPLDYLAVSDSILSARYPDYIEVKNSMDGADVPVIFLANDSMWLVNSNFDKAKGNQFNFDDWDHSDVIDNSGYEASTFGLKQLKNESVATLHFNALQIDQSLVQACLGNKKTNDAWKLECINKKIKSNSAVIKQAVSPSVTIGIYNETKLNIKPPKDKKKSKDYLKEKIKDLKKK